MKSSGARSMPEIADTVPDSVRSRVSWTPQALKNCIIAIAPLTSDVLCSKVTGPPTGLSGAATRGSQTLYRYPVGSSIKASYSSGFIQASSSDGSRYW